MTLGDLGFETSLNDIDFETSLGNLETTLSDLGHEITLTLNLKLLGRGTKFCNKFDPDQEDISKSY
jgi:hypothetical protein